MRIWAICFIPVFLLGVRPVGAQDVQERQGVREQGVIILFTDVAQLKTFLTTP